MAKRHPPYVTALDEPWPGLEVPRDWAAVAAVCRGVWGRVLPLAERVVGCIRSEIPEYESVSDEEGMLAMVGNLEMLLRDLAQKRGPQPDELAVLCEVARARAIRALPVESHLQAYHIGFRELWAELAEEAMRQPPETSAMLLGAVSLVWQWIDQVTKAVAGAHEEVTRAREAVSIGVRQRFLDLLVSGDVSSEEIAELARSFGFDPSGTFLVACVRRVDQAEPHRLDGELRKLRSKSVVAFRAQAEVIVFQAADATAVELALRKASPRSAIGIGLQRLGLAGARLSLGDAEGALQVSMQRGEVSRFAGVWLESTILHERERLAEVLAPGIDVARTHPHLAEAVRVLLDAGLSISEAGRRLSLHPNSVTYRLDRWQKLTGWDPRTRDGLLRSVAALVLADARRVSK